MIARPADSLPGAATMFAQSVVRACRLGYIVAADRGVPAASAAIFSAWCRADVIAIAYCLHQLALVIDDSGDRASLAIELSLAQIWHVANDDY